MTPAFEVTWGDVALCETYGLFVEAFEETPPAPKTYIVDVPGGQDIDLTEALTGHTAYSNRRLTLSLYYDGRTGDGWAQVATDLKTLLHGMRSEFTLSWDPGYTYTGKASVTAIHYLPRRSCRVTVEIDASPWKVKEVHTETVSAVGGVTVTCESGRRPVHPLITCDYPVTVNWQGQQFVVPSGQTYRMTAVTFTQGENKIWLSIYAWKTATWADVASQTWADLAGIEWAKVVVSDGEQDASDFPGNGSVTLQWSEEYI